MLERARRRPVLTAALIYALLAVAFVSPALEPGKTLSASDYLWTVAPWENERPGDVRLFGANGEQLDAALQFQPGWDFTKRHLGDLALWNPHIMGGHTFVGNFQSALFSPFTAPVYVLSVWDALAWIAILKLFVAAFGTFLLGRALGMRFGGALLSGVVYAYGLYFVAWLAWPTASVWAWIPLLLFLTEQVIRRPRPLAAAGLATVVGLQFFGGHPESSFHVVFAACVFFVLRALQQKRLKAALPAFLGGLVLGGLLAAITIFPFLEAVFGSHELTERSSVPADKVKPEFLFGLLVPEFWGRPTELPIKSFLNNRAFYVGALPLMLAIASLVLRPSRERLAIAGAGFVALATVTGIPPFHQIVNALPVFTTVHNGRLTIIFLLAMALLAGFGLDDLTRERAPGPRARWVPLGAAALLLVPLVWLAVDRPSLSGLDDAFRVAWLFEYPPYDHHVIRLAALMMWLAFAGAAVALLFARMRGRLSAGAFAALAVGLAVVDLFAVGMGLNPAIREEAAEQPATGSIRYLQERRPMRFAGAYFPKIFELLPVAPNLAMRYELYDARGYDFPLEQRYTKFWESEVDDTEGIVPATRLFPVNERSLRALSLMSVADVIASPEDPPLAEYGLELAYEGPDARVWSNERALPRAFVVGAQRPVDGGDAALAAITDPLFDARAEAVVEEKLPDLPPARPAADEAGSARIAEYEPDRVSIDVEAERPGLLVLTDVHQPGWKATVDGEEAEVERVNYFMRGVRIEPGAGKVEFRYEPLGWRLGWIASLAALIAILATVFLSAPWTRPGSR